MLIYKTKKKIPYKIIHTDDELIEFIIEEKILGGPIKELIKPMEIYVLLSQECIAFVDFKRTIRKIYNKGCSVMQPYYWTSRGFTDQESIDLIKIHAKKSCEKLNEKYAGGGLKQFSVLCPEYWEKQGFPPEAAKRKAYDHNKKYGSREYLKTIKTQEEIDEIDSQKIHTGNKNGMWGRVPGKGAGNGVSGHYKNFYFRSTSEYFFIKKMELCGETIQALDDGVKSVMRILLSSGGTYTPDFYIPRTRTLVDVKNQYSLKKVKNILSDIKEFCDSHGMNFETVDERELDCDWSLLKSDVECGIVIIDPSKLTRYKNGLSKYENRCSKISI